MGKKTTRRLRQGRFSMWHHSSRSFESLCCTPLMWWSHKPNAPYLVEMTLCVCLFTFLLQMPCHLGQIKCFRMVRNTTPLPPQKCHRGINLHRSLRSRLQWLHPHQTKTQETPSPPPITPIVIWEKKGLTHTAYRLARSSIHSLQKNLSNLRRGKKKKEKNSPPQIRQI